MIVCKRCGHGNEDDPDFCGSCGAFLEFEGEKLEPEVPDIEPVADQDRPGVIERVKDAIFHPDEEATAAEEDAATRTDVTPPPTAGKEPAGLTEIVDYGDRGKPIEAKVPQKPVARPKPKKPTPARRVNPGDIVCGQCGEPNQPDRKFCRRCGTSIVDIEPTKIPWWRRIFRRRKKTAAPEAAAAESTGATKDTAAEPSAAGAPGTKTRGKDRARRLAGKGRRLAGKARIIFAVAAFAGVALVAFLPAGDGIRGWFGDRYDTVRGWIAPEFETVNPFQATANASVGDQPPEFAVDLIKQTYWQAGVDDTGDFGILVLEFPEPVDLDKVVFLNGADEAEYANDARLKDITLIFNSFDTQTISLDDDPEDQTRDVSSDNVLTVAVQIVNIYPGLENDLPSLREIEFKTKK